MLSRRDAIVGIGATAVSGSVSFRVQAQTDNISFSDLLEEALRSPDLLLKTRERREGLAAVLDIFSTRAIAPRYKPFEGEISADAIKLITAFEVTDQKRYEARYQQPIWPGGSSGVTIGIGYDIGYVTKEWLHEDWSGILDNNQLTSLERACKVTGRSASNLLPDFKGIRVSWKQAQEQFMRTGVPRFVAQTLAILPNSSTLHPDCIGALASLVYNRGPSFKATGDRYVEMRAIRSHMVRKKYELIPEELIKMKRLWEHTELKGLVTRRRLEAALFRNGLDAMKGVRNEASR